jgi:hypothetical protein
LVASFRGSNASFEVLPNDEGSVGLARWLFWTNVVATRL